METYRCLMLETGESKMAKAPKYKGAPLAPSKETYAERVAALKKAGQETKRKHAEAKAKRKAAKAKKKAGKSWTKAVKKQKKKGEAGVTLSSLIARRKGLKKGTAEYASVQNKINKAYGSKVRHKATAKSPKKPEIGQSYETAEASKPTKPATTEWHPPMADSRKKYKAGGKVEGNAYGWPSRDARNGGKK